MKLFVDLIRELTLNVLLLLCEEVLILILLLCLDYFIYFSGFFLNKKVKLSI